MRLCLALLLAALLGNAAVDWPRFRGPNGSGVAESAELPIRFGPEENLLWKTGLPAGYSSPVLTEQHIFLTAHEGGALWTICLDRETGSEVWRREPPRLPEEEPKGPNSPVSPSPVTDGENVYSFFEAFGLVSYSPDGEERWRLPLGPFNTPYGVGASPIIAEDTLLLLCDQDTGSFLLALDKNTGTERWQVERKQATHGFSSPVLYHPEGGEALVLVSGSYRLIAYTLAAGEPVWWVDGMSWQAKSVPVVDGDDVYVHSWMASPAELGFPSKIPPFEKMLASHDTDGDGRLSKEETPDQEIVKYWFLFDLDKDGHLTTPDWDAYRARNQARNGLFALRPQGKGDQTATAIRWTHTKELPNIPSPLLYRGILYVLKEGGILTSFDPETGEIVKQGRVQGALGAYFASPVAADGKIYTVSKEGKVAVLRASEQWEVLAVNDLGEDCWATPAIADGRLYIRTEEALYCFATNARQARL